MLIDNVVSVLTNSLPIGNHPFFANTYENFSKKRNSLAEKLENKGIDIKELLELIDATQKLERLGYLEAYKLGLEDGKKQSV